MGLCTQTLPEALALGLVLELFWIDGLRLGGVVPPSASLSFLLLYPLCLIFSWDLPQQVPIPLLLSIMCAHAAVWLEQWHRSANMSCDARLELWAENEKNKHGMSPEQIMTQSHWRVLWSSALLYMVCFGVLFGLCSLITVYYGMPSFVGLLWSALYGIGLLGAVLALRTRRAYIVLAFALGAVLLWQILP